MEERRPDDSLIKIPDINEQYIPKGIYDVDLSSWRIDPGENLLGAAGSRLGLDVDYIQSVYDRLGGTKSEIILNEQELPDPNRALLQETPYYFGNDMDLGLDELAERYRDDLTDYEGGFIGSIEQLDPMRNEYSRVDELGGLTFGPVDVRPEFVEGQITDPWQLVPGVEVAELRDGEVTGTFTVVGQPYPSDDGRGTLRVPVAKDEHASHKGEGVYGVNDRPLSDGGVVQYRGSRGEANGWNASTRWLDITDLVSDGPVELPLAIDPSSLVDRNRS